MMKRICTFVSFLALISYNSCDASLSIQYSGRRRLSLPRGGGEVEDKVHDNTNIEKKHQQTSAISLPLSSLPLVDTLSVSLALRLTAETNRRLQHSTSKEQHKEETLFHSSVSYQESPELKTYLDTLLSAAGLEESTSTNPMDDERQVILSLALLYIDRSTSVDTPTDDYHQTGQMGGSHPSPYISPRTVHYVILTSLSIAIKCVRGDKDNDVSIKLREAANSMYEKDSISAKMEQMERTLLHSLAGSSTGNVSHEEISTFMRQFATMMYPQRQKAHEQTKLKQLERFMRHQNAGFGTGQVNQHGHGNHWQQSDDSHANNRLSIESRVDENEWQTEQQYYPDQQQY